MDIHSFPTRRSSDLGTLISAILLLLRQEWRTSINRFAEAMTLFAVASAGLYPAFHTGRPWFDYWLFPYPNTMGLWPQFRSPLMRSEERRVGKEGRSRCATYR